MPAAAATRESIARLVGRGYEDIDFAVLLVELAKDAGLTLVSENVQVSDGLQS
jgi:3-hydroxyisobutyrate dehydrogenase